MKHPAEGGGLCQSRLSTHIHKHTGRWRDVQTHTSNAPQKHRGLLYLFLYTQAISVSVCMHQVSSLLTYQHSGKLLRASDHADRELGHYSWPISSTTIFTHCLSVPSDVWTVFPAASPLVRSIAHCEGRSLIIDQWRGDNVQEKDEVLGRLDRTKEKINQNVRVACLVNWLPLMATMHYFQGWAIVHYSIR